LENIGMEREDTLPQSPLDESDLIVEIATHLDMASLMALYFTSKLAGRSVTRMCRLHGLRVPRIICEFAASEGHLSLMLWMREYGCFFSWKDCADSSLREDHSHILRWMQANCPEFDTSDMWSYAICHGRLEALSLFASTKPETLTALGLLPCRWACAHGRLEVLQWLRERGCPWESDTAELAAERGHLHILKWARENGCTWERDQIFQRALEWERYEVTDWIMSSLHEVG
jgi:hypothetical protein